MSLPSMFTQLMRRATEPAFITPQSPGQQRRFLIFGAIYIVLWIGTWYASRLLESVGIISLWFLPAGLRFFCLLVFGWPGVLLELAIQFVFALMQITAVAGTPIADYLSANTLWRLFNLLGSLVANALVIFPLRRRMRGALDFTRPTHSAWFLAAALIAGALSGLVGTFGIVQLGFIKPEQFYEVFPSWLIGDFIGIVTLTPLLLVRVWPALQHYLQKGSWPFLRHAGPGEINSDLKTLPLVALALLLVFYVPWNLGLNPHFPLFALLLLLPLATVAWQFGLRGAVLAVILLDCGLVALISLFGQRDQALHYQVVMIANSLVGLWLGGAVDRTRIAEAARRQSDASFRATFNQAAMGIAMVAPDGRWLKVNQKLCTIVGYTLDDMLRKTFQDITHPDDLDLELDNMRQLLAGKISTFSMEKRYRRKDGAFVWINLTVSLVLRIDGAPDYFISMVEDIQQRKEAEAALRISEATLKEAQRLAGLGNWAWDLRNDRYFWSEEIYRLHGRDRSLPALGFQQMQAYFTPDSWVVLTAALDACLARGTHFSCDSEAVRGDGPHLWVSISGEVVRDADGKMVELRGTVQDITERKRAENELEQHRHHLEQLVSSRTAELSDATRAAESANRAKTTFLSTMSHEIRTPLNAVVGLAGLLTDSPLTRRQRDYADKIQAAANVLRAIVDDILDFSKIEAGALRLEHAPFSLDAILRTVAAVVSARTMGKPIEVLFDVGNGVPDRLIGDALRVQQILINLVDNAAKFTDAGEIVVAVHYTKATAEQVKLEFRVRDTGIGIAPEKLGTIFDAFTQNDSSTTRLYGGTGLGLAISARLADLMGSHIEVSRGIGQGSEFSFTVALGLADQALPSPAPDEFPGLRVLIVDDHPLARTLLTQACAGFGWQASALECAVAGLDELRKSRAEERDYDLLLLDWRMPDIDGIEMLRQATAAADISLPLVVLMVSTYEMELAIAAADDLYLDSLLSKPITPASLLDAVTRAHAGDSCGGSFPLSGKISGQLKGLRLLVAEDNALNQFVVEQILTRAGAVVVMTSNGLAAVEALRSPGAIFDAVLMDIQMPLMDGYAATRMIREDLGYEDLPIIAVTAYAQLEDREKCRRAGMVGHITKPIKVDDLLEFLPTARRRASDQPSARPALDRAAPATMPGIEVPLLDVNEALKTFGGDAKKYGAILRQFAMEHAGDIDQARHLFDLGQAKDAASLIHRLRGMAAILHATELSHLSAATEGALGNLDAVPPLFDELQTAMRALQAAIEQFAPEV